MPSIPPISPISAGERYAPHIVLAQIGGAGQQALSRARVAIVGLGGLGNPLAQYLVAAGIATDKTGALSLIDDDIVAPSNLQRQTLFAETDIGAPKIEVAAQRLRALNSDCNLHPQCARLDETNGALLDDYDIIADASDNFETRFLLNDICAAKKKILISAAIHQFQGHLMTFKAWHKDAPSYRDFIPAAPADQPNAPCTTGIVGAVAGVMGSLQALEVIKEITGAGESLAGKILIYDGLACTTRLVRLSRDTLTSPNTQK